MEIKATLSSVVFKIEMLNGLSRVQLDSNKIEVSVGAGTVIINGYSGSAYVTISFFNGIMLVTSGGISNTVRDSRIKLDEIKAKIAELGYTTKQLPSISELAKLGV